MKDFKTWADLPETPRVIPVIVLDDASDAAPLAETLVANGLPILEVTLRSAAGLPAIEAMAKAVPSALVGAGTVLDAHQAQQVKDAGGRFAVSPGATDEIIEACAAADLPLLPGSQTLSEIMALRSKGFRFMKLFPANIAGGAVFLKAVSGVVQDVAFCPTGGVSPDNVNDYLSLPNVRAVGGSWIADAKAIASEDWAGIEERARAANNLTS